MATQNATNLGDSIRTFTGVASWGGSGDYFDDTTLGSFTVSRPGTGFVKGKPVAWTAPQTITGLTAGNTYYICIDGAGAIYKTTAEATAMGGDYIMLFECLRDSTSPTNNQITVREDHPYTFPYDVNHYLHDSIGAIIENRSKGANITLNGTQKIQINGEDTLLDHGLSTTIPDSGGVAVVFRKKYTDGSGKWCMQNNTDTFAGYYNNAGTPTALGATKFAVYTLYVSKDTLTSATPTYYAVLDTSQYNNQGAANTAIANGTTAIATNELAQLELCKLGYIVFGQAANAIVEVIISKSTFQSSVTTAGSSAASLINTVTTAFDGILSAADTNVQTALNTIDEWGKTTTDHALLIGNGTGVAIGSLSVGATGQILTGVTSNDPAWTTATYPATVSKGDVLVASADNVIGVVTGAATSGYVLTANGSGAAPTFQANSGGGIGTLNGDSGSATGATVTIAGGTGITTSATSATVTITSTTTTLNTQTDSYALVLGDAGKLIRMNKSTANTLTVPKNSSVAFATGTFIMIEQLGAGQTTIAPVDGDVTINASGAALALYLQYSVAGLIKTDTDTWVAFGDLT